MQTKQDTFKTTNDLEPLSIAMKPNRKIFLVEDDLDDQELLNDALTAIDPNVNLIGFTNGMKFFAALENTADEALPCLIVLDYNIPEINGAEILRQLHGNNRYHHITKIIWSTSGSEKFRTSCLALGAKDYVIKPSSLSGIQELAATFLGLCKVE